MRLIRVLVAKDLRRALRNPAGWLVFLAVPMVITALVGMVFGARSEGSALGKVRFALVDEDDSRLTRLLRNLGNQGRAGEHFEVLFLTREAALAQIQDNKLSGMLVIPAHFTRDYLQSTNAVELELVKNPAESIHPAVLEEMAGVLVTALDALKKNFGTEFADWSAVFEGRADYHQVSELITRAGDKFNAAKAFLDPPRIVYGAQDETGAATTSMLVQAGTKKAGPSVNLFGLILPGMAAMFLLFLAEANSRDFQRELMQRTLQRIRSLRHELYTFVASKILFCLAFLILCSGIMLGLGGMIFRIPWRDPAGVILLTIAYCLFAGGLTSLVPALIGHNRESAVLGNLLSMGIGLAGGSAFPAPQLPALVRNYLTPHLPNYWYAEAVKSIVFDSHPVAWWPAMLKLAVLGLALTSLAAWLLHRRLERGQG